MKGAEVEICAPASEIRIRNGPGPVTRHQAKADRAPRPIFTCFVEKDGGKLFQNFDLLVVKLFEVAIDVGHSQRWGIGSANEKNRYALKCKR